MEDEPSPSKPRHARRFISDEILNKIFLLLPARTVSKFRFISKCWQKSISDPAFAAAHAVTSPTTNHLLIFRHGVSGYYYYYDYRSGIHSPLLLTKLIPGCDDHLPLRTIVRIANGLLMFFYSKAIHICNPCTREITTLPVIVEEPVVDRFSQYHSVGFGVDPSTGKYKVVRPSHDSRSNRCTVFVQGCISWRTVACPYFRLDTRDPVYLGGVLYWLTYSDENPRQILSFNLCDEKFTFIPSPPLHQGMGLINWNMEGLQGCLCYVECGLMKQVVDIWMLKESVDGPTNLEWRKTYNIKIHIPRPWDGWFTGKPEIRVMAIQTGKLLIATSQTGLYSYDLDSKNLLQLLDWHEETDKSSNSLVRDAYMKGSMFAETLALVC